jgi:radical S-adenosyl methionine domain-containing protein 2
MSCEFCFATFQGVRNSVLPAGHLPKHQALQVVSKLAAAGFRKINFAGGEPFLCPWLDKLAKRAKDLGMVTSVVTNGSLMNWSRADKVLPHLDWFVLSVDSVDPRTLQQMGRVSRHGPLAAETYLKVCQRIKDRGIRLKINTVVTAVNRRENLTSFIREAAPYRWKIMQVLPLVGPDVRNPRDFTVTSRQFSGFLRRNRLGRKSGVEIVPERDRDMVGSYVMVDPAGRFYDNTQGVYRYSAPILGTEDVRGLLAGMNVSVAAFEKRGGAYEFQPPVRQAEVLEPKPKKTVFALDVLGKMLAVRRLVSKGSVDNAPASD